MGQSIKAWIGLTAVAALLVVVAGWFLFISPTRAATAETRADIELEQDRTVTLTKQLDTLKAQFATLDESRAKLEALKVQVPNAAETAAFRRTLADRAAQSGATILSVNTAVSTAVEPTAATEKPAEDTAATDAEADADAAQATPSPAADEPATATATPTTASGPMLVGIPLEITLVGTYNSARAFIASLQTTEGRLFLVNGLGVVTQTDGPASSGRPATVKGDVEFTIQGMLFVITPSSDVVEDSDGEDGEVVPPLLPTTERNPFAPVGP